MSGADQFTCKECGSVGDYYATRKARDPRPGARRVICGECVERIKRNMLARGPYKTQTASGIGHKGGAGQDMANFLSGSKAADARGALLKILNTPMTAEQASRAAGLDPDYASPRISELVKEGFVQTHDRKGVSDRGNPCGRYVSAQAVEVAA